MAELFGYVLKKKEKDEEKQAKRIESFVAPTNDDGSLVVTEGGVYGTYVDLDGSVRTEAELVNKYRQVSEDHIVDLAIQDIVNEAIVEDEQEETVSIVLDDIETQDSIKTKITEEFKNILDLLEFDRLSYEIFKRWYVDGRLYYHVIIDEKRPSHGILELRYIDPRNIKKVREVKKEKNDKGVDIEKIVGEYYVYNKAGFIKKTRTSVTAPVQTEAEGLKISKDSIAYCTSGYQATDTNLILSYLHKAIRPLNQLRSMEDSLVIYRISRAPERRIFYVDVGGLPKPKAEQYLRDIMTRFKNKVVYDSSTGEIRDDRKFMTMLEDFWLPRREGGRGTEITTLPGGQNLGEIEDVEYFQNQLYRALNVPVTRMQPDATFTMGRATEISRDEVKFTKFITRLRAKFSELFTKLLERQLILTGVCTYDDWKEWKNRITYDFAVDNYFNELKNMEMMRDRLALLGEMVEHVGTFFSNEYIKKQILQQSDEEIKEIEEQNKKEEAAGEHDDMGGDDEEGGFGGNEGPDPGSKLMNPDPAPAQDPAKIEISVKQDEKEKKNDEKPKNEEREKQIHDSQMKLIESMTKFLDE